MTTAAVLAAAATPDIEGAIVGIDLGTTNSVLSYYDLQGQIRHVSDFSARSGYAADVIPSVIGCDQTADKTKCCDKENTCIAKTDAMWKEYGCVVDTPTATTVSGG